ncbi:penicillin-binding protein, partial [bacterium]|nr:penicillin-binding protein [bacterium]
LDRLIEIPPTSIFASDGSLLAQIGGRTVIPDERIPEKYKLAVLAAEDDQFYQHPGIDKPALTKAVVGILMGKRSRGGSTITQQLAKNLFFTFKKSTVRKFREILAALEIDYRFNKDEILEAYCNGIPFGKRAYGIEEAAMVYFSTHAADLTLAQSALLAGIPNAPGRYNPYRYPDRAISRQKWILGRMKSLDWIDETEYQQAVAESLVFKPLYASIDEGSYFIEAVIDELEERYDENIVQHGGLKIYTTLDPLLQGYAIEAVQSSLRDLDIRFELDPFQDAEPEQRVNYPQASMVSVENATGAVLALVGGRDWQASQFNRATKANRNMGSSLKPALYLTAIEKLDYTPATVVLDSQIVIEIPGTRPWRPSNFTPNYEGHIVLKYALMKSINTVAARLVETVHPESMAETLRRFGMQSKITPNYAIALGANSFSTVEMAGMISSIANMGEVVQPFMVYRVEDHRGRVLEERLVERRRMFSPEDVYQLIDMMKAVIDQGTGAGVRRYGFTLPAIGKTGTTNDYRDSWFIGATPRIAAAAWVGFDDNRPMTPEAGGRITGASGGLPVWANYMAKATEGEPVRDFIVPPNIEFRNVEIRTGKETEETGGRVLSVAVPQGYIIQGIEIDSTLADSLTKIFTDPDSLSEEPGFSSEDDPEGDTP